MVKDISQYMEFSEGDGRQRKRSLKSMYDKPAVIKSWKTMDSKFRDGNPTGKFVQMTVEVDGDEFLVNTGSSIIMEQLDKVHEIQERDGEKDISFSCMVRKYGRGVKLFPVDWVKGDVGSVEGTEAKQDGSPEQGL